MSAEGSIAAMARIMSGGMCVGTVAKCDDDKWAVVLLGAGTSLLATTSGEERLVGR